MQAAASRPIDGSVLRNIAFSVWLIALLAVTAFGRYWVAAAIVGVGAVLWSERKRWKRRIVAREQLEGWAAAPLRWEAPFVIQENAGRIDTREHYSVRWEIFENERALYFVTQGTQTISVSTLAPNAKTILVDALRVANYPPLEWPNLDL